MKIRNFKLPLWAYAVCLLAIAGIAISLLQNSDEDREIASGFPGVSEMHQQSQKLSTITEGARPMESTTQHSNEAAADPQRLRAIARHTFLQLLNPESLTISDAAIAVLGLSATQVGELNEVFERFLASIKREEVAHAYVNIQSEGSQEIVVDPFDRSKLIEALRNDVATTIRSDVGDFIAEQAVYDRTLAVNNSELRLSIERGDDEVDRVVFTQQALRQDALDAETPIRKDGIIFAPTFQMITKTFLSNGLRKRYEHLFSAVDRLPHK